MKNLLIDEYPLLVMPSLAVETGLNEAIILQQIHYWLVGGGKVIDGRKWIYNTYEGWNEQFPFWSISTIRRSITNLEKENYIFTANYNKMRADKTKWYSINYEKMQGVNSPCVQNEQSDCSKWTAPSVQNEQSNTRDYTETNTDINILFSHWNEQGIIQHKKMNQKMKSHANARLQDYELDDLKEAITNYKKVLSSLDHYWSHKWTFEDFMKPNNVVKFLTESDPFKNYAKNVKEKNTPTNYHPSQRVIGQEELPF